MAKNKSYDKRIFRLLFILNRLDEGAKVNSRELANEFTVTIRSVQRDIDLLRLTGFLIVSPEKGIYSFEEGFSLRKLELSHEEASLLSFLNDIVRPLGEKFTISFSRILKKVIQQEYSSPYYAKIAHGEGLKKYPFIPLLERCISESRKIVLKYEISDKTRAYRLWPLKIIFFDGFWYLLAIVDGKEFMPKFRLDKIKEVKALEEYFIEPQNIKTMLDESVNIWFSEKKPIKIVLRAEKEAAGYFKKNTYVPHQKIVRENKDGSLIIEASASQNMEIIPAILRWIPCLTVMEPADFREEIRNLIAAYLKKC